MKKQKLLTSVSIFIVTVFHSAAVAQTEAIWLGSSAGWDDALEWSTDPDFPSGSTFDARIESGTVYFNNATSELNRLILTGGTFYKDGDPLSLVAGFNWSGGNLEGDYQTEISIANTGSSSWSGNLNWQGTAIINTGNLNFADGIEVILNAGYGANTGLRNSGLLTLLNGGAWKGNWYGEADEPVGFTNEGTLVKEGAGNFLFTEASNYSPAMPFTNTGTVDVRAGTLEVRTAVRSDNGTWQVASGANLIFAPFNSQVHTGTYVGAEGSNITISLGTVGSTADFSEFSGLLTLVGVTSIESEEFTNLRIGADSMPSTISIDTQSSSLNVTNLEIDAGMTVHLASNRSINVSGHLDLQGITLRASGFGNPVAGVLGISAGGTGMLSGINTLSNAKLEVDGALDIADGGILNLNFASILRGSGSVLVENGGIVNVNAGSILQGVSSVLVENGGELTLNPSTTSGVNVTLNDTSITTDPGGVVRIGPAFNSSTNRSSTILNNTSIHGTLVFESDYSALELRNGSTLSGTINFNNPSSSEFSPLVVRQDWTTGNLTMADTTMGATSQAALVVEGTHTVTLGSATSLLNLESIIGDMFVNGVPLVTGDATLINQGLIQLNVDGKSTNISNFETFINQGRIEVINGARVTIDHEFNQTTGTFLIGEGSTVEMLNTSYRSSTRTMTLAGGSLEGQGEFVGNIDVQGGTIAPGSSPGLLSIDGDINAFEGAFVFELGGTGRGTDFDALDISGALLLDGTDLSLSLTFINSFHDSVLSSQMFTLIEAGTLSGNFANVGNGERLFTADGSGSFLINYGSGSAFIPNHVILTDFMPIPEPGTVPLFLAAVLMGWLRMRTVSRRSQSRAAC